MAEANLQDIESVNYFLEVTLSRRLDTLWRHKQYIAYAEGYEPVQAFWRKGKEQEKENIVALKKLLSEHTKIGDF